MTSWPHFFALGWGASFTVYVIFQAAAPLVLRKRLRLYALVPLPFMAYVALATARAFAAGNMNWPLLMIVVSPWAAFGLGVLVFRGVRAQRHPRARVIEYLTVALLVGSFLVNVLKFFRSGA